MKQVNVKKLLILNLPYLLFVWLFDKAAQTVRLSPGADLSGKLLNLGSGFSQAMESIAPSFHPADLLVGLIGAVVIRLIIYTKGKNAKKYRKGMEYGSARWGTAEDIKPYIDPVFENNVLLTQTERLMMSNRPKNPKYARNKNILVIGGSGSGKTRFFVKPNLMQLHSSYVVTDPKGTLILETGSLLVRAGYKVKVLNTINFKKSMHYNPFAYLRSEKDILKLTNTIIANTKGDGEKSSEDFWVKAERLLYCALIGYIWYEAPEEEKNFITLLEMINASEAREDDEEFQSPVDLMFSRLEEKEPDHFAVKQYKKYKLAAGGASYLEKQDFIIMNQQKRIEEKQALLDGLMMKIEDVNAVVEEAVDLAYEKACEVVTERVKEETVKHDVDVVKDYGELLQKQPKEKISDSSKSVASKVVNAIVFRLEKASQVLLGNIISALNEPKNKTKAKEQIKEHARVSIQEKLKAMQKQIREDEQKRDVPIRKKNMEL